jgi:large subunit ribosomal protein L16
MNFQKSKYRRIHKPRLAHSFYESKRLFPLQGSYALKVSVPSRIPFQKLDSARRTIKKIVKKNGIIWQMIFADRPATSKPAEVRMGKGKGSFSHNVAIVSAGSVLFELGGLLLTERLAVQALEQAARRLGLPTQIIRCMS